MTNIEDFTDQRDRFYQIVDKYKNIEFGSIHRTALRIAAHKWIEFVNYANTLPYKDMKVLNSKNPSTDTIAKL